MDDYMFRHLQDWAASHLHDDEREAVVDAILKLWEDGDDKDRARWAAAGWRHMLDLVSPVTP